MYYVTIPKPVKLMKIGTTDPMMEMMKLANGQWIETDTERKPMSLFQLICDIGFADVENFGKGWKAQLAIKAIYDTFEQNQKTGVIVELQDDHMTRLQKSLLMEGDGESAIRYDPKILLQIGDLLAAIKNPMDEHQYKKHLEEKGKKKPKKA